MAKTNYLPESLKRQAFRSVPGPERTNFAVRHVVLHGGRLSDVFTVDGYVMITAMFMRITEAVTNSACNMSWVLDPDDGGANINLGGAVSIANKAIGISYVSELDNGAIDEVAAAVAPINILDIRDASGRGAVVPSGGIDVVLSANVGLLAGEADFFIQYEPITTNAKIWPGTIHTSTTSSSSSSSTTSSSSSTASTTSSSSSTTSSSSSSTSSSTTTSSPP